MRALTLLESLAEQSGNPYKIDASKLGAIGISTGAIATSVMNGVDNRMKAAVMVASAGNWQRSLRYPNSWLYHDIFVNTRNQPYNGKDPVNSIANVDTDPTLISFLSRFDPIRYAPRQHGPVMTIIGTHDQYFPLPNANLAQIATLTLGAQTVFEKRLWLVQNATNSMLSDANLFSLSGGIRQWLDFCFGKRAEPLATPQISLVEAAGGLRFEITLAENSARLTGSTVQFFAATRIDSTGLTPFGLVQGFNTYPAIRDGTRFIASIVEGEKSASGDAYTAQNVIYFATINDPLGLPVSSLVYKARRSWIFPRISPTCLSITRATRPPFQHRQIQLMRCGPRSVPYPCRATAARAWLCRTRATFRWRFGSRQGTQTAAPLPAWVLPVLRSLPFSPMRTRSS